MKPEAVARVEAVLGARAASWSRVAERGYAHNERWLVRLEDGGSAFAKAAVDDLTAGWLRTERRVYEEVHGDFLPVLLGWDEGTRPVLVLEDLTPKAAWPPPWTPAAVDAVLAAFDEIAATQAPDWLPRLEQYGFQDGWKKVAADPGPFLTLGLCSADWLTAALPALLDASERAPLAGDALVHCDVRSDNLCIRDGRAVLFDWNIAAGGSPAFDLAFWLPSLALEGGPEPEQVGGAGTEGLAPLVAGFFACRAGLPQIPHAPRVRGIQLAQLEVALPWCVRALGLPALDPEG